MDKSGEEVGGGGEEGSSNTTGLRDLAKSLKHHLRGLGNRFDDDERREHLEDTSRCCLLQDRAYEWAEEARRLAGEKRAQQEFLMARPPLPAEHFNEMISLAEKLGNNILLEQCQIARDQCYEALEIARTSSIPASPSSRRRSWDEGFHKSVYSNLFISITRFLIFSKKTKKTKTNHSKAEPMGKALYHNPNITQGRCI